uniref:Carboxylesterase type B domain-containing protein n=1 Tax=Mycena chlorophos TaxID=658473 RepID=A0ABQ0M045_MYCCL|nr:predicted protein [Mycena chlorophos]
MFGESAGSTLTSLSFLNPSINRLARAGIFESGWASTLGMYPPSRNQVDWDNFASSIPTCAGLPAAQIFSCIQLNATSSEILAAISSADARSVELYAWTPVLDGELITDLPSKLLAKGEFAKLPFITGTNLDEGTLFTPQTFNSTEDLEEFLYEGMLRMGVNLSAPPSEALRKSVQGLLALYPDDPALGAPFGTGNEMFGLSPVFKRTAAILTDLMFLALRRQTVSALNLAGVPVYGYLFIQPQPELPAYDGVTHGTEVAYVYGYPADQSAVSIVLSDVMVDYWISFATSLTPNDGLGIARPRWEEYTPANKPLMQLNGANLTLIPDDFRTEQTNFINANSELWGR